MSHRPPHDDPEAVYHWYSQGMDQLRRGNPQAAATALGRAAAAEPQSRSIREALARAHFDAGRFADAHRAFSVIIEADPADDYARFGRGLAAERLGDDVDAVEHLALASAMRPDDHRYRQALRRVRARLARASARPAGHGPVGGEGPARDPADDRS